MRFLIGRYHEISLKGRNRWRFTDQVKHNLRAAFADYRLPPMREMGPRLIAPLPDEVGDALAAERAALVFGIQNFSISRRVEPDIDAMKREAVARASEHRRATTFRISTKREDKRFPMTSPEIERIIGREIVDQLGMKVNLTEPELTISIEVMRDGAYVSAGKIPGAGGLPVGVTGRAMALISGGIDSPLAAYRMMKRGLRCDFVHFHAYPLVSAASREKACDLVNLLTRYQSHSTLALVPFGTIQREIVANSLRPLRVVLYRRLMLRIAAALAERTHATALVTGESLGQVASQTLENIAVIERASPMPMLRPLLGMDKNEIIEQARALGTFETSILPDQDCCTLFVPAHPETHARLEQVGAAEARLDIPRMVSDAVRATEVERFSFPPRAELPAKARVSDTQY